MKKLVYLALLLLLAPSPLATLFAQTVGFSLAAFPCPEYAMLQPIGITMTTAPAANVQVEITDLGSGTATSGLDYGFASQVLTFTPVMAYPNTLFVFFAPVDDGNGDAGETVNLGLTLFSGTATLGLTGATVTLDERAERLIVNEFSQGNAGNREFMELLVVGTPATTVDLSGVIVDDNNGDFSGGPVASTGIAQGYVSFEDHCTWEKVPVGSVITIYNSDDPSVSITLTDNDSSDRDEDHTFQLPVSREFGNCLTATPNAYLHGNNLSPEALVTSAYAAPNSDPCFSMISLRNGGDAVQVRSAGPSFALQHGVSYGLPQNQHPDFGAYGAQAVGMTGSFGANRNFAFVNTVGRDEKHLLNWNSFSPPVETPGTGNNPENQAWIDALRQPFPVPQTNTAYTCDLRGFEARRYYSAADEIHTFLRNDGSASHGTTQVSLTFGNGILTNFNLVDAPTFVDPEWEITPSLAGTPNVRMRLYLNEQQLTNFVAAVNLANGTAFTNATMAPLIRIYRAAAVSPRTGSAVQVTPVTGSIWGTYGGNYFFEASISNWGRFALGVPAPPLHDEPGYDPMVQEQGFYRSAWVFEEEGQSRLAIQSPESTTALVSWYSIEGKLAARHSVEAAAGVILTDAPKLPKGLYLLEVRFPQETLLRKVSFNSLE
jgi:hypothetical protein